MEKSVLTPELIKRCNPGVNDFGLGQLTVLASQCLRSAKKPTPCDICLQVCPVDALVGLQGARPHPNTNCIKCGACISACPSCALAGSLRTIQQINRLILQATLRVERLAITCERTLGLLRLEKETDAPEYAEQELALIEEAVKTEHLYKVPCLAMLRREIWFTALNEIGVSRLTELLVYLPPGQCDHCPANALGAVEETFSHEIEIAEHWTGEMVGLVMEASGLPQVHRANVRDYLMSANEVDRRGLFTGFVDELKASWDENTKVGNKALDEVQRQRARKQTFERTRLWAANKAPKTPGRTPIAAPVRYALIEALGRNSEHADDVVLTVSTTDNTLCTRCGECIDACPVRARRFIDAKVASESESISEVKEEGTDETAPKAAGEAAPAATDETTPATEDTGEAAGETTPATEGTAEPERSIFADPLYCLGCSACMQICPAQACSFTEVRGSAFLLD
ncbi:MAG: 4Fe-4S binding protein [Coriobacteriales bacterium]|jgi:ferredoxin|nr:4Fe-4S binding protein [Coriobacteriales bacterium]